MWKIRIRKHNIFGDYAVFQIIRTEDDEVRGSFTVHEDELESTTNFWKSHGITVESTDD